MAPPIVNPHAPAAPTARIWFSEATEPATITGQVAASTTARMSDSGSADTCRYASRSSP